MPTLRVVSANFTLVCDVTVYIRPTVTTVAF